MWGWGWGEIRGLRLRGMGTVAGSSARTGPQSDWGGSPDSTARDAALWNLKVQRAMATSKRAANLRSVALMPLPSPHQP